jgi:hypothetical protein
MKAYGKEGACLHSNNSPTDLREWSGSGSSRFNPFETVTCTNFIAGWVGPKAGLNPLEKMKVSCHCPQSNLTVAVV